MFFFQAIFFSLNPFIVAATQQTIAYLIDLNSYVFFTRCHVHKYVYGSLNNSTYIILCNKRHGERPNSTTGY